jgi:hypothetical protein
VGVIIWRDDECETAVKENNDGGWSSNDILLWLEKMQNRDTSEGG